MSISCRPIDRRATRATRRSSAAAVVVIGLLALAACGGGSDDANDGAASPDEIAETIEAEAPAACAKAFPAAFGKADIADMTMLPADWPAPPPGSTLCQTAETVGGSRENADYATELDAEEVLAAYEGVLDPAYDLERQPGPLGGEVLVGDVDGIAFQITPGEGKFTIALAK